MNVIHELRWRIMSPRQRAAWTDKRLNLGDDFWLFVNGVNNSGTTLLHQLLASHSRIRSLPREGQKCTSALRPERRMSIQRRWAVCPDMVRLTQDDDPEPALRAKFDWSVQFSPGAGILLEKTPRNAIRSRWLQQNFDPARFITIVRSPYAVCEGIRRRTGCDIETAATHWTTANEYLWEDMPHLKHCMTVHYEDFCGDPQLHLRRIQTFLGLAEPFDVDPSREIKAPNIDGKPMPLCNLNQKSLQSLTSSDIATINHIARDMMVRLGYDAIEPCELPEFQRAA